MGIRVRKGNTARLGTKLVKIAERSTRELRRTHRDAAYTVRDVAEEMAPFKTGELEGSIEVWEQRGAGGRKVFEIGTQGVNHAIYMHESVYDLGPGSREKQRSSRFIVGRKFIERAVAYVLQRWGYAERARKAVRNSIRSVR